MSLIHELTNARHPTDYCDGPSLGRTLLHHHAYRKASWEGVFESIRRAGPERCILSTDLGQTINPPVSEGFALFAQKLLDAGFTVAEIRHMAVTNPAARVE